MWGGGGGGSYRVRGPTGMGGMASEPAPGDMGGLVPAMPPPKAGHKHLCKAKPSISQPSRFRRGGQTGIPPPLAFVRKRRSPAGRPHPPLHPLVAALRPLPPSLQKQGPRCSGRAPPQSPFAGPSPPHRTVPQGTVRCAVDPATPGPNPRGREHGLGKCPRPDLRSVKRGQVSVR